MKRIPLHVLSLVLILVTFQATAQYASPEYSRVKIDLQDTDISVIARLGLETDHGQYAKEKYLINDFSRKEIELLRRVDIQFEILIDDVKAYYKDPNRQPFVHSHDHHRSGLVDCPSEQVISPYNYETPVNYEYGSMGGYLTYDELLVTLDDMVAQYPELITARQPIDTILTHEGRPVYWLRLSDNANTDEDEPEVLYTALHHAREPNSLSQMVFYLWYMLENYATDPEVQYLVDNTQMYFIPCVNPDGYVYNNLMDPDGGGLWRKNRYAIDGEIFGVDLNRNYGYEWGFNDNGSSPNPTSQVYRGPEVFSEPETQAVRSFCNDHNIQIALNYHTYGNLLIHPWGYSDTVTDEDETFSSFGDVLTGENDYLVGTGSQTVGYTVNGNSDDWMYGETDSKPAIYSMTPEVGPGSYGFWPPQSEIDLFNKSSVLMNKTAAHLLLNYGEAEEFQPQQQLNETIGTLDILVKKYGLLPGEQSVSLTGLEGVSAVTTSSITSWTMSHLDETGASFDFELQNNLLDGAEVRFLLAVDNGTFAWTDTLTKVFVNNDLTPLVTNSASNTDAWAIDGPWDISTESFYSEPSSYADSPIGDYGNDVNSTFTLAEPFDLGEAIQAQLRFYARWNIEDEYDYVQVMASIDGNNFSPLCGLYTTLGGEFQDLDEPLYDSEQDDWVLEEVDLSEYLGEETVWIRFRMISDGSVQEDGFFFDDLSVSVLFEGPLSLTDDVQSISDIQVYPVPVRDELQLSFVLNSPLADIGARLVDALGREVHSIRFSNLGTGAHKFTLPTAPIASGLYIIELYSSEAPLYQQKLVKSD